MSTEDARSTTLAAIRRALGRESPPEEVRQAIELRLRQPRPNVIPARAQAHPAGRVALFLAEAERVDATTGRLADWSEVPAAVGAFLKTNNLAATLRVAPDPLLGTIPWSRTPMLHVDYGPARDGDLVSVTTAFAAIAETGTLMLFSGRESPTSLNFLPDVHIAVLPTQRVVGTYEEAWELFRERFGNGAMPRVVNWITGPSRTADIEQTLLLGAHGPRRLHILLVDAPPR
jgi:L-lactate dehydrogenase complex protein LldG